jgi:CHAD domain-containing protein
VTSPTLIAAAPPTVEAIDAALAGRYMALADEATESDCVFYDTFDGRVRAAGLVLVHADGRLSLRSRAGGTLVADAALAAAPSGPLLSTGVEPGELRDRLDAVLDVRAARPLAHVRVHTEPIRLLDDERKTVVRVAVESAALITSGRRRELTTRVRLEPVRGYAKAGAHAREALIGPLELGGDDVPLVDEAVLTAGGVPEGVSSKVDVELSPAQPSDEAAVAVLRRLVAIMGANLAGTIADIDSEFLHDYRVAVRRTRSVQRELRYVFGPEELAHARGEFRWLQQVTGDARDLDVYVLEFASMREMVPHMMRGDLDPLLTVLNGRRLGAHRAMVRELRSERAAALGRDWDELLGSLTQRSGVDRPDADRPIGELAAERIRKVYRTMVRMGDAIDGSSPAEDYHELRKKGKELRYLLELFGGLFDGEVVKPMIKALKGLQDVLGRHQDREVQATMLSSLRDEVSALPGGAGALMAMGVLVERLDADALSARDEFAASFAVFASKEQRRLVKEAFSSCGPDAGSPDHERRPEEGTG